MIDSLIRGAKPAIIVHGGATKIASEDGPAYKNGCLNAARAGWKVLSSGGSALDAAETAIRVLEDDATFNAGYGSELNETGEVEMDAALMDGATLDIGAVGALQGVRNPVAVARLVMQGEAAFLVGSGARRFAEAQGIKLCQPSEMISPKQHKKWLHKQEGKGHDTVGCVALDKNGNLAAGTSTGGTNQNAPGRIGDSPLVGCGFYADNQSGACALTGDGEKILRVVLAKSTLDLLREEEPDAAIQRALQMMVSRIGGEAGCILIDAEGRIGWGHNSANMACAYFAEGMSDPLAFVHKDEETDAS
jgi:beta-aspartyl-peptidase (threonine type)